MPRGALRGVLDAFSIREPPATRAHLGATIAVRWAVPRALGLAPHPAELAVADPACNRAPRRVYAVATSAACHLLKSRTSRPVVWS